MGAFAPGLKMCGVCGEWMTQVELEKHRYYAHRGLDHISAKGAKWTALYTVPAGIVLAVIILLGGLEVSWLGFPLILWACVVFVVLLIPVIAVAVKPSSEANANAMFRCWVCDTQIPHRELSGHLRQNHPEEARDFRLAEATFAVMMVLFPLTLLVPALWRFAEPNLRWYWYIGPELAGFVFLFVIAVYASRWPQRIARARMAWATNHWLV